MTDTKQLLTQEEARVIRDALCAINVVGAPMLQTAVHRPSNSIRVEPETFVFVWEDVEDDLCQIMIYSSYMNKGRVVMTPHPRTSVVEQHDTQQAFFKAYGIDG